MKQAIQILSITHSYKISANKRNFSVDISQREIYSAQVRTNIRTISFRRHIERIQKNVPILSIPYVLMIKILGNRIVPLWGIFINFVN